VAFFVDIAGLLAVLPRLLALPVALTSTAQQAVWRQHLAKVRKRPFPTFYTKTGSGQI
jgi:hypothetical protein